MLNMKIYLELTPELFSEIYESYTRENCICIFQDSDKTIIKCDVDFLTCARLDQRYFDKIEIYHSSNKWPECDDDGNMIDVVVDKGANYVRMSKNGIEAVTTIFDSNYDIAEEEAMLFLQAKIETDKLLKEVSENENLF